eukprot:jgi/Ulvmu1/11296/UM074_0011.1
MHSCAKHEIQSWCYTEMNAIARQRGQQKESRRPNPPEGRHPQSWCRSALSTVRPSGMAGPQRVHAVQQEPLPRRDKLQYHVATYSSKLLAQEDAGDSASRGSILTLSGDGSVSSVSERLADHVVARSELLWALRDTAGSATVPIEAASFHAWQHYHERKADIAASELASVLEVSLFLDDKQSATQTSRQLAAIIRSAYRRDLRSTASTSNGTLSFPHHPTTTAGPALKYVFTDIQKVTPASVSAILPHLTLCEGLACPDPFPSFALSHFLSVTPGHLDLSPPRVPTHSRPLLHRLCSSIAPLLADIDLATSLTTLSVPVTALRGSGQLPVTPIAPLLGHVTHLRVTPEPAAPSAAPSAAPATQSNLSSSALLALLQHLSHGALCHVSAPVPLSPCPAAGDVFNTLATFTGLTSLTIGLPAHPARAHFTAMAALPTLKRLHLTHAPRAVLALGPVRLAPSLTRLHATGNGPATRHILASSALSFNHPLPQTLTDIGADPRANFPGCPITAAENRTIKNKFDALIQTPRRSLVLPLGSTKPDDLPNSAMATLRRLAVTADDAQGLLSHLKRMPNLTSLILFLPSLAHALPPLCAADLPALRHVRILLSQSISVQPRELHGAQALAAEMLHSLPALHTFEAVHLADVSEEAVAPMDTVPQCMDGFGEAETDPGLPGGADDPWSGEDGDAVPGEAAMHGSALERDTARSVPAMSKLHTVRVSRCLLGKELREALQAAAATDTLRVLCVLSSEAPSATACTSPSCAPCSQDLRCLSNLTSLRKLSIEGQQSACMLLEALTPLHNLTALQLRGTEACEQAACEVGGRVAQLTALQQLSMDIVWQGSNLLAAAYACSSDGRCAAGGVGRSESDEQEEASFAAVEREFWAGTWGTVMELPMHRGARISFRKGCTCVAELL